MRIAMLVIGSTGDVRPFVLLGQELKRRGHEITIATFASFEGMVREAGLGFFSLAGDVMEVMANIMKPGTKGVSYLMQVEKSLKDIAPVLLRDLMQSAQGADAMCCTFFGSMYYSVAEKYHIPCVQVQYCPVDPNGETPISSAPGLGWGRWWNHLSYRLGYLLIGLLEKKYLTGWRRDNGISLRRLHPHPDYALGENTIPVIYAISPVVMPRPRAWGANIHMSGFWWDDTPVNYTPPRALKDFLAAGERLDGL